jgi:hypothetical protein
MTNVVQGHEQLVKVVHSTIVRMTFAYSNLCNRSLSRNQSASPEVVWLHVYQI